MMLRMEDGTRRGALRWGCGNHRVKPISGWLQAVMEAYPDTRTELAVGDINDAEVYPAALSKAEPGRCT